jgi:hypothetical protein
MKRGILFGLLSLWVCWVEAQQISFANFNSGLPAGWNIQNGGTTADTWYITGPSGFANNTLNGTAFAFVNSDAVPATPARTLSEQLKSPVFNGSAYGQVFLEFDQYYRDYSTDTGFVEVFNGNTWVVVASYSSNSGAWGAPAHITLNLTAHRNANMQVRFRYEDRGIWAWYWAVDNVHLYAPYAFNASLVTLNPTAGTCGLGTTEPVAITVRNDGTSAISSLPVSYQINGGAVVTEIIPNTLAPGGSLNYTFVTGANLSAAGVYNFKAWTGLALDGDRTGDTLSNVQRKNHTVVNSFPYVQDFESNNGGWFATGTSPSWAWGSPNKTVIRGASSGIKVWTTGGLTGDYPNNESSYLEGPCLDLRTISSPWFGTDIWWNTEFSWDGAALQASVDSGRTWATVGAYGDPYNWYNDETIDGNPGGQRDGWTGRNSSGNGSGGWIRAVRSLANFSGNREVLLRIAFASDGSVVDDGIAFDRITIAAQPVLDLGPDLIGCDSVLVSGGNWASYIWSTQDTSPAVWVTQSGSYSLAVRDSLGFPAADVVQVQVDHLSGWSMGPDVFLCDSVQVQLTGPVDADGFAWSTGDTTSSITIQNSGVYALQATSAAGCQVSDSIEITYSDLAAIISPGTDTFCRGSVALFQSQSTGANSQWWDFGNGSFSNSPNPATVYLNGGTFVVELKVEDGNCVDSVSQTVVVEICTGTDRPYAGYFDLYPNPSQGNVVLRVKGLEESECQWGVWDMQGRKLMAGTVGVTESLVEMPLDLSGLPGGAYSVGIFYRGHWESKICLLKP